MVEISFAQAGGIQYKFGLEWAKMKLLLYYRKFGKPPIAESGFFYFFKRDCRKGILKQYGIMNWKDLLEISLSKQTYYQRSRQSTSGIEGLKRSKLHLRKLCQETGKIPRSDDTGCKFIAGAIRHGFWTKFEITTWGDIIFAVFGYVKGTMNLWKGGGGLNRAMVWIKNWDNQHGKLPTTYNKIFASINQCIKQEWWIKNGIRTQNDLFFRTCGKRRKYEARSNKEKRPRGFWTGKKGFENMIHELKTYHTDQHKLPTAKNFPYVWDQCRNGRWKEFNINSWNNLLFYIFGKVNVVQV
jgi:hypothetical protein